MNIIIDNKLDLKKFKEIYTALEWTRVPRKLSANHSSYFYIGKYEDNDILVKVQIRPSMRMKVQESYKHCDIKGNKIDKNLYKGDTYTFGSTVEVIVDNIFLDKIKEVAKELQEKDIQKVSW